MLSSIIVFLLVLSVLILVHEIGHFIAAKKSGVWVEEFGVGYPPRLFGKKIGETVYSVNILPFGGFVKLHGEASDKKLAKPKRAFINKSKKERAAIILAGVAMNFVLAIVAFAIVYSINGIPKETGEVRVLDVRTGSPAHEQGILVGDVVKQVGEEAISSVEGFINIIEDSKGEKVTLSLEREVEGVKELRSLEIIPRKEHPQDEGPLGVSITSIEIYFPPIWQRPFVGIYYGFKEALFWGGAVVLGFADMISGLFRGIPPKEIAGPVGLYAITAKAVSFGVLNLINFVGILSVNLVILNILPFPALDGGRLLFLGIEAFIGRRILPKVEAAVHAVGLLILILLLFIVTIYDIRRLIVNGGASGFIDSFIK